MANAKKAPAAAQAATPDVATLLAMIQQLQAAQTAPKAAAPKAAAVDPAKAVVDKLTAAGVRITRTGKSGVTPKGHAKAWVDVTIGGVRIQGNAFLTGK